MSNGEEQIFEAGRRRILQAAASALLVSALSSKAAWGQGRPAALDAWETRLRALNEDVLSGGASASDWLRQVEQLNGSVSVSELARHIDLDGAVKSFTYGAAFPHFADIVLPGDAGQPNHRRAWTTRVIGVRKGAHALPHVHNRWVEAHLVMAGSFQIRTYDRLQDLPEAVVLRPVRDDMSKVGDQILMSDRHENCHWFIAQRQPSVSFYVSVMGVPPDADARGQNVDHTFVDPTAPAQSDGTIVAPTLSFAAARAKFDP